MPENLLERAFNLDSLPTLPSVAMEAIRLMEGQSSTFDSLAELLKNDQVLTGKILRYANSAHVGARREITTIPQAISAAGFNAVRSIILSVSIFDSFSAATAKEQDKLVRFWLHSIGVAATAETLAHHLDFPSPDEAYLCGLIHDLGKLVCYQQFPDSFARICREIEHPSFTMDNELLPLDVEQAIAGFNHVDAGKIIGERYGFPDMLTRSMWLHHQPVIETIAPENDNLPQLIRFADVLCVTHNVGSSYFLTSQPVCHENFHFALENLARLHHLTSRDLNEIMENVHHRVEEVCKILGFWDKEKYQQLLRSANASLGRMSLQLDENNQVLSATNQVLAATCEMHKRLHTELSLKEAAEIICDSVCRAFEVERSLCLIRDPKAHRFVGSLAESHAFHDIELPTTLADMTKRKKYATSDIEIEAANRLEQATHDLVHGRIDESRMFSIMSGSKFLATFFVADKNSRWRKEPLLGQLLVDFSSGPDFIRNGVGELQQNFEAFAAAAGTAIERLLLQQAVNRQARKLAETSRKMEQKQQQLFHSHRLATVGHLAYGTAHEINNPLTVISLNLQLLKRMLKQSMADKPEPAKRLDIISGQVERIASVVTNLMSFAKPTEPKFDPINVVDVIKKALSMMESRESLANITIDNQLPAKLAAVLVDPQQIEQVFLNLFINSCQAMPDGGTLTIQAAGDQDFIDVSVRDTGHGIARKDLGKVFDPFFTTKLEGEGTGLGLAVCHTIMEHNKGTLRVESVEGRGTTFLVRLPLDKSDRLRQMKKILKTRKKEENSEEENKYRILVVDDEESLNSVVRETLQAAGYSAEGAYDGVEGVEKLRNDKYHAVLLDLRMPRKDGFSVLKFIKQEYPEIAVVIITGHASMAEIQETAEKGAFACLKKPFMLDKMLDTIARAIKAQESPPTKPA
ncbi:MAG: hypothetical protein BM485_08535 [Desulfobulbaceae bacterium DB1]|nr:MAG: hypothetical protein BM485_08535 [Desulfobulbaceae bacterium DB1]